MGDTIDGGRADDGVARTWPMEASGGGAEGEGGYVWIDGGRTEGCDDGKGEDAKPSGEAGMWVFADDAGAARAGAGAG